MSPGQTGHITGQMGRVPGTDGTHTRGCPAKILYVYWFFFSFPNFRVSQKYRTRCHPGPSRLPQECPKINPKKRTWYQPRRHVCILRFLLRSASEGVQRDRTRDSPFPPEKVKKTYLVPGWKARLSARHVWKMQRKALSRFCPFHRV